jgi:hypothetical protein
MQKDALERDLPTPRRSLRQASLSHEGVEVPDLATVKVTSVPI